MKRKIAYYGFAAALLGLVALVISAPAQTKKRAVKKTASTAAGCRIGATAFRCSRYYAKGEALDADTLIFKSKPSKEELPSYLFVSMPAAGRDFDENRVKNRIAVKLAADRTKEFVWRPLEPALMNLDSRFEKAQISSLGFNGAEIVHFVGRRFEFRNRTVIVGYGYPAETQAVRREFEAWLGGDDAGACNEIATILNSITKEHRETEQYCYLMTGPLSK
ncbi:MAG: hypothetical protein JSS81_17420 [Acidobacteria bacterium]|nr:hypothetical protein [Acidobacteriota bacterium]